MKCINDTCSNYDKEDPDGFNCNLFYPPNSKECKNFSGRQQLFGGDGLLITPDSDVFRFECCKCGLVHKVTIEHKKENVILRFFEEKQG